MKAATLVGAVVIIGGMVALATYNEDVIVDNVKPDVVVEEVTPDWASDTEAVEAAKAVIRRKELEADKNRLEAEIEALEASLDEINKELGTY